MGYDLAATWKQRYLLQVSVQEKANSNKKTGEKFKARLVAKGYS